MQGSMTGSGEALQIRDRRETWVARIPVVVGGGEEIGGLELICSVP